MAFLDSFDTICEMASEAAQVAAKKTKKLAEIAKANVSIYSEEDKIKKAQLELGKLYYRDYVVGEEPDQAEYLPWCQRIDEAKQTIADLRDYVEELKAEQVQMEETETSAANVPVAPVIPAEPPKKDMVTDADFADLSPSDAQDEIEIVVMDDDAPSAPTEPANE